MAAWESNCFAFARGRLPGDGHSQHKFCKATLRRSRADSQYPSELTPSISIEDATYCYETSVNILKVVNEILDSGRLGTFSES